MMERLTLVYSHRVQAHLFDLRVYVDFELFNGLAWWILTCFAFPVRLLVGCTQGLRATRELSMKMTACNLPLEPFLGRFAAGGFTGGDDCSSQADWWVWAGMSLAASALAGVSPDVGLFPVRVATDSMGLLPLVTVFAWRSNRPGA
jgi:hypothetical protein